MLLLLLTACAPLATDTPSDPEAASAEEQLDFDVREAAVGAKAVQGLAVPPSSASDTGDTGDTASVDSGALDTGLSIDPACSDAGLDRGADVTTYVATPPLLSSTLNGVAEPARVLRLDSAGCAVVATLSDSESEAMATGFGTIVSGGVEMTGLMLRLVETLGELWLFSNGDERFWRIDPSTGAVTPDTSLGRYVTGAVPDGVGGAWVVLGAEQPWPDASSGNGLDVELLHLDFLGNPIAGPYPLPLAQPQTGFAGLTSRGSLFAHFQSNDLALDDAGQVWVLSSDSEELLAWDIRAGSVALQTTLGLKNPTGITFQDGQLVLATGLHVDASAGTTLQDPGLYTVDLSTGAPTLQVPLPVPSGGWDSSTGFGQGTNSDASQRVVMQYWFAITPVGDAELLIADPGAGRLLAVQ